MVPKNTHTIQHTHIVTYHTGAHYLSNYAGCRKPCFYSQAGCCCAPSRPGGLLGARAAFVNARQSKNCRRTAKLGSANHNRPPKPTLPQISVGAHNLAYLCFQGDLIVSKHTPGCVWTRRIQKWIWIRRYALRYVFGYGKPS